MLFGFKLIPQASAATGKVRKKSKVFNIQISVNSRQKIDIKTPGYSYVRNPLVVTRGRSPWIISSGLVRTSSASAHGAMYGARGLVSNRAFGYQGPSENPFC